MSDRQAAARDFCNRNGWAGADWSVLAGDASSRRYFRLHLRGKSAVLMDDPGAGSIRTFTSLAAFLADNQLSAPEILARDKMAGFLLLEDLGDDLFSRLLENQPELENRLYSAATDVIVQLHRVANVPELTRFDAAEMTDISILAADWYAPLVTPETRAALYETLRAAFRPLENTGFVVALRDYHAENLLWLPERAGSARVGLLDFQDAVLAHPAYDLVSALQDARRDVSGATETAMLDRYCTAQGIDTAMFRRDYALLGVQRNLRILGIFARLCLRDGKARYVSFIPRVWRHLKRNLAELENADLTQQITATMPEPTDDFLNSLRLRCPKNHMPS